MQYLVKKIITEIGSAIDSIKRIMFELCFSVRKTKFFKYTDYAPVKWNETCWSPVCNIPSSYIVIFEHLQKLKIEDLDNFILNRKEKQNIDKHLDVMEMLNSITIQLQKRVTSIAQFCCYSGTVAEFVLLLSLKLSTDSAIVKNHDFESVVVKIQLDKKLKDKKKQTANLL